MRTQQGMIDGHLLEPDNPAYTIGFVVEFGVDTTDTDTGSDDTLDPALMAEAVRRLLEDAGALRVRFSIDADGVWRQRLDTDPAKQIHLHDLRGGGHGTGVHADADADAHAEVDADAAFAALVRRRVNEPFDLLGGALCRFDVAVLDDRRTAVCAVAHHAICDGYGSELVRAALLRHVVALSTGGPRPPSSLGDYGALVDSEPTATLAQNPIGTADGRDTDDGATDDGAGETTGFWLEHLRALPTRMAFSERVAAPAPTASTATITIPTEGAHPTHQVGSAQWWPTVIGLVALYTAAILDEDEAVLGLPLHNRVSAVERVTPAMLMTELPLRIRVDSTATLGALAGEVRSALAVIRPHTSMRPEALRHALPSAWRTGRVHGPTVNVFTRPAVSTLQGRTARSRIVDHGPVQDMSIVIAHSGDAGLELRISVNPRTYSSETLALHLERLSGLIGRGLALPPTHPIASIPVLTDAELAAHDDIAQQLRSDPLLTPEHTAPTWGRPVSVAGLFAAVDPALLLAAHAPAGHPAPQILNGHGRPVTFGEVGELTIGTSEGRTGLGVLAAVTPDGLVYRGRREDRTLKRGRWVERDAPPRDRAASDPAAPDQAASNRTASDRIGPARGVPDPAL